MGLVPEIKYLVSCIYIDVHTLISPSLKLYSFFHDILDLRMNLDFEQFR